jgi:hypothetical protein
MSEITITNSDWTDLGVGPMTVQLKSWKVIYIVYSDAKPASQNPDGRFSIGKISTDRIRVFDTQFHVWAMCSPSVISATLIVELGTSQTAALDPGTYLTSFFPITLGQKTLVNSMSVALASDHGAVTVSNDGGFGRVVRLGEKVTKSDTVDFTGVAQGFLVGTAGTANLLDTDSVTHANVPMQVGYNPIVGIKRVKLGGTADDIWTLL